MYKSLFECRQALSCRESHLLSRPVRNSMQASHSRMLQCQCLSVCWRRDAESYNYL